MTEPVAWKILKKSNWRWEIVTDDPSNYVYQEVIPLYTAEQLHPRVKMTQAEFDEFKNLFEVVDYASIALATIQHVKDDFNGLGERVYSGTVNERIKKENNFNVLWANYDPNKPEETIEIVPNMKWFVVSKEPDNNGEYEFISGTETPDDWGYSKRQEDVSKQKADAHQFDNEEEAEKWTNPLTEAVQLPVEDN